MVEAKNQEIKQKVLSWFSKDSGIECLDFYITNKSAGLFYIPCMVNKDILLNGVLVAIRNAEFDTHKILQQIQKKFIASVEIKAISDKLDVQKEILNGCAVLCVKGEKGFLSFSAQGYEKRAIAEPPNESVIRGPREGFVEDIEANLGLVRKRLKTPTLAIREHCVGKRTNTRVCVLFLEDVASLSVVNEIEEKLDSLDIDGIVDSYYIEEYLGDEYEKFFKKIGTTEKPDVFVAKVLEGRVGILVDGSPISLTLPYVYFEDLQSPSDYYDIPAKATVARTIRMAGLLLAVMLPGIYVALQSYQYRVLPINFLISLLNSIEGISFPPILEILFVLFLFEILNEASIRMPKQLGMALSIIGALILGNTAVQAGIITPPSIVVVAISGITIYIIPNQSSELLIVRTIMTILGGISGFYGLFLGFFMLVTYMASIETFGTPYLAPYAPNIPSDKKDGFIKQPIGYMRLRPKSFAIVDKVRLKRQDCAGKNQKGAKEQ